MLNIAIYGFAVYLLRKSIRQSRALRMIELSNRDLRIENRKLRAKFLKPRYQDASRNY